MTPFILEDTHGNMMCPGCGDVYVHPARVIVNAGGSITSVSSRGTRCSIGAKAGRGVRIELAFDCEQCGERQTATFQFHKGATGVSWRRAAHALDTIWRD